MKQFDIKYTAFQEISNIFFSIVLHNSFQLFVDLQLRKLILSGAMHDEMQEQKTFKNSFLYMLVSICVYKIYIRIKRALLSFIEQI